jgi:colanic acid/amylovoran biosynthesis glycosyltransferase
MIANKPPASFLVSQHTKTALRVGIVTSTFPFSNAEAFLHAELEAMTKLGCQLTLFPAIPIGKNNTRRELTADVVRLPVLGPQTMYRALLGFSQNVRGAFRMLRTIVLAANSMWVRLKNLALLPTGLAVAHEARVRQLDHIHAHWLSGPSTVAFIASEVAGIPWSYTGHSWDIFLENNLLAEKTGSAVFGRTISEFGRRGLVERVGNLRGKPLEVIHLGVALPHAGAISKNDQVGRIKVICPANFYYFKDHPTLLKGLRRAYEAGIDCRCVLAGEGPLRGSVARKVKELGLHDIVSMPGVIPHKQLLQQLQSGEYDSVVMASLDLEGIPVSLIEAMAAGVPCIATRLGAIGELIEQSCGILVEQQDDQAFATAIILLARSPELRKQLGDRSRQKIATEFDTKQTAQSLVNLILGRGEPERLSSASD